MRKKPEEYDYDARLMVYGLPTMDKKRVNAIADWLTRVAKLIREQSKEYGSTTKFWLMKPRLLPKRK